MSDVQAAPVEVVPIDSISEHPLNPRRGDVDAIAHSIRQTGFHGTLLVHRPSRLILVGNHRWKAAKQVGLDVIPVEWFDGTEAEAMAKLLNDNAASDRASTDDAVLADLLQVLAADGGLEPVLYDDADLVKLLEAQQPPEPATNLDGLTPAERSAAYEASGIRSIVLPFAVEEYREAVLLLGKLRSGWGVETNTEVLLRLLREAVASANG